MKQKSKTIFVALLISLVFNAGLVLSFVSLNRFSSSPKIMQDENVSLRAQQKKRKIKKEKPRVEPPPKDLHIPQLNLDKPSFSKHMPSMIAIKETTPSFSGVCDIVLPPVHASAGSPTGKGTPAPAATGEVATTAKPPVQASTPLQEDEVDEPPVEKNNPQPVFPDIALSRGYQGWVKVRILINELGSVDSVTVLDSKGHRSFKEAVLLVVPKWKFKPAHHNGRPVKVWAVKTIRFEIED